MVRAIGNVLDRLLSDGEDHLVGLARGVLGGCRSAFLRARDCEVVARSRGAADYLDARIISWVAVVGSIPPYEVEGPVRSRIGELRTFCRR
jgi:hypothetical protein